MVVQRLVQRRYQTGMQGRGVDHPGDERPRFLGIPTPILSPAHIGPDGSYKDADAQGGDGRREEQAAEQGE